uniref:Golgi-specific brefeldin A-resistance guanine nucleotide exchange factor 1 n=2 Tax=Cacopsylla melanoneura TaxID=428564 RepID=A0A8D8XWE5_9HEMI
MAVCPKNGTLIIQGEINKLLIAMKRGTTWSSYSQQDDKIEALLKKFNTLKSQLNAKDDLKNMDPIIFLEPFLEVITSDQTSTTVTSLALVSINTFLSYSLIDPGGPNVGACVCKTAEAVTRPKFSNPDLDSVVLMRMLLVLRNLVLSPIGVYLTNENICEIMSSIFRICFETRLTELLRKYAEHCLKEIVQCLFTQLSQFSEDLDDPSNNVKSISTQSDSSHTRHQRQKKHSQDGGEQSPDPTPGEDQKTPTDSAGSGDNIHLASSPCERSNVMLDMQGDIQPPEIIHQTTDGDTRTDPNGANIGLNADPGIKKDETLSEELKDGQNPSEVLKDGQISSEELKDGQNLSEVLKDGQNQIERERIESSDSKEVVDKQEIDHQIAVEPSSIPANDTRPNHLDLPPSDINSTAEAANAEDVKAEPSDQQDIAAQDIGDNNAAKSNQSESNGPTQTHRDQAEEYINQQGVRFTASDPVEEVINRGPYGMVSVRELLRCLVQLCDPHNKNNSESMIHIGLTLLTVAMEVGADSIAAFPSLMAIVKDDLCKHLIGLLFTADRLATFAANLQLLFLVFESMRHQLKFQFEMYLTRLEEIIISDNQKFRYEMKEIALESIVQLWRTPGLVTELYLNYDCNLFCPNLYEEQTKMLSKNCFPVHGIYNFHLLSLDALLTVIDSIENFCKSLNESKKTLNETSDSVGNRTKQKGDYPAIPSHEELMAIKRKKKLLTIGTEQFNMNSKKGIKFLQEQGLLSTPLDPVEVVQFLRDNPHLDKKTIGEYLSNRSNLTVLDQFVKSFDFVNTRIDIALRMYLETFRLPGESPLISLLMEQFADHWHKSNNCPFANSDAAFTLVYAIIMLNVDQHNHNVRRQNNPMTLQGFKKNLTGVNGGADFDPALLDDIYKTIKEEEIVMPAEHTGLVRDNYLWKVLLKRGQGKDGVYISAPGGSYNNYNHDLFSVIFSPSVAALSYVFDKTTDSAVYNKSMSGFRKCAMISAYYGMSNEFDNLTHTLCKFSTLLNVPDTPENQIAVFGCNPKARISTKTVFDWAHRHGDILREGWKPILECILQLYKWKLLPKILVEAEDFLELSGKISLLREETSISTKTDKGFFSTFYNSLSLAFAADQPLQREPTPEERKFIDLAQKTIMECPLDVLITESKFFRLDSLQEFVKALIGASYGTEGHVTLETSFNEDTTVLFLELLLKVVIQNRDRAAPLWPGVRDHLYTLLMRGAATDQQFLVERTIVGVLRLAIRLMSREEMSPVVLQSLRMLLLLKWSTLSRVSRQIAYGLYELLKTSAANIHTDTDWAIVFTLLECVGAGRPPPRVVGQTPSVHETGAKSDGEVNQSSVPCYEEDSGLGNERGYTSDSELVAKSSSVSGLLSKTSPELSPNTGSSWILVGREGEIQPFNTKPVLTNEFFLSVEKELFAHDPFALVKCCESLAFLVRDAAHITPYNFENCVRCIRTFVEAILETGEKKKPGRPNREKSRRKLSRKKSTTEERAKSPTRASSPYDADESDPEELPNVYPRVYIQLLDLMHTLHIRTAQIYRWWADENPETEMCSLWSQGWCPLLQGIARLCCDTRKDVRSAAITYLQRALLVHDLQTLTGDEWEACFRSVLFPLLVKLLEDINEEDVIGMEEMRMRAATLLSKVFLHHLSPLLLLPTFTHLWLQILDLMDKYMHADGSDLLGEAIPESLKNILLVMDSAKVFSTNDGYSYLWTITWERINQFLPHLKEELFKSHPSVEGFESGTPGAHTSPQAPSSQLTSSAPPVQLPASISTGQQPQHNISADPISSSQPPTSGQPVFPRQMQPSNFPQGAPASYQPINIPSNSSHTSESSSFQPPPVSTSLYQTLPPSSSFQPISNFQPATFYPSEVPAPTPYYHPLPIPNQTSSYPIENALHQNSLGSSQPPQFLPMPVPPNSQYQSSVYSTGVTLPGQAGNAVQGIPGLTSFTGTYAGTQSSTQLPRTSDTDLPLSQVSAPHPIINIVTQPQSYTMSDPGAPPQLTEEVVSPSSAIAVPARHAAPTFPQLISTPLGPPLPLSPPSDSFLSAFVPTPSSNSSHFYTPNNNNPYSMYAPGGAPNKPVGRAQTAAADQENAKNFFYQPISNSSSESTMTADAVQSIGSPPRTGILLNPDLSNITANLPSVMSPQDS